MAQTLLTSMYSAVSSAMLAGTITDESDSGTYAGVDVEDQYLDLSGQDLGIKGLIELMDDVADDTAIIHLNISRNIQLHETAEAKAVTKLFTRMIEGLEKNKYLTALDVAGNYLGHLTAHPATKHTVEYLNILAKCLARTKITHLDISDNNLLGSKGQLYKPLTSLIRNYVSTRCILFKCQHNHLHSESFRIISESLSFHSSLTHLDLSHNIGGLDPFHQPSSQGIVALTTLIPQCPSLHTLKLADNHLRDDDIVLIANVLLVCPCMHVVDISGNSIELFGAEALYKAIHAHAAMKSMTEGLWSLDLSNIPLSPSIMTHITSALRTSESLQTLSLNHCSLSLSSLSLLKECLYSNTEIAKIGIEENEVEEGLYREIHAEAQANGLLKQIRFDPIDINILPYTTEVHNALRRKLHCLPKRILRLLHENQSFEDSQSPLHSELYRLAPPLRKDLFRKELGRHVGIRERLLLSTALSQELDAARIIYHAVIKWFARLKFRKKLMRANLKAKA